MPALRSQDMKATKITKKRARRKHTVPGVPRSTAAAVLPRSGLRVQARLRVVDYRDRGSRGSDLDE